MANVEEVPVDEAAANEPFARSVAPPTLAEWFPQINWNEEVGQPIYPLTSREFDVLRLLPTRLSNLEMANRLRISRNTVKTHLKEIYRKLRVCSRNEAIVAATRMGLFTLRTTIEQNISLGGTN